MDFQVADRKRRRRNRRLFALAGAVAAAVASWAVLARLAPAEPEVSRESLWTGVVERGELIRQVRGPGTLEVPPEEIRWIAARTAGRVEARPILPGTPVEADTVVLVLENREVELAAREAALELESHEAELRQLRDRTRSELLEQENAARIVATDFGKAERKAKADARLFDEGLVGELIRRRSQVRADELRTRDRLEQERLSILADSSEAQIRSKEATVEQYRAVLELRREELASLTVRAGATGILLALPVEVGQEVTPGANLARIADPTRLKAVLRVAETRARDVEPGQSATVDTRNGLIAGIVVRVDPAVREGAVAVDVRLDGPLPRGARPDLSVDGTIDLDRLADVLHVGRPAYGRPESTMGLFRIVADGRFAERVTVGFGRSSVNRIEVRSGLEVGDEIILSDASTWDAWDRIRLR